MTDRSTSSRRAFLKAGALAAAPAAAAVPAAAMEHEALKARAARLQDEAEIRRLHQAWLRRINAGEREEAARLCADPRRAALDETVRVLTPDPAAEPEAVEVAPDGRTASARYACTAEVEIDIAEDCTLVQMAHAQGGGVMRRSEPRILQAAYVKTGGAWAIDRVELSRR